MTNTVLTWLGVWSVLAVATVLLGTDANWRVLALLQLLAMAGFWVSLFLIPEEELD